MMNKKGFEFSVGLIVILIISVLIFSLSLVFIFKWFGAAEELKAEIDKQTKEQILTALKTGSQLVVIPVAVQSAKRGTSAVFGIGIRNIAADKKFSVAVEFSGAYLPDGRQMGIDASWIKQKWIGSFGVSNVGLIRKNEQVVFPFLLKVDLSTAPGVSTAKGDYVFNVCVYNAPLTAYNEAPAPCNVGQYKLNSEAFYSGKVYQVTVKVV